MDQVPEHMWSRGWPESFQRSQAIRFIIAEQTATRSVVPPCDEAIQSFSSKSWIASQRPRSGVDRREAGSRAFRAFEAFAAIVGRLQAHESPRSLDATKLTGLIYATLHGTIDLKLGGRAKETQGLGDVEATVDLLLDLLAPADDS